MELKTITYLKSKNIPFKVLHLSSIAKTAQDVERLYGATLQQILKTLLLISDHGPVIAVVQGNKKLDMEKIKKLFSCSALRFAREDEITTITGYVIGGVSPFGIETHLNKVIDTAVFEQTIVNIGGGTPYVGIEIAAKDLKAVWDGIIADIT